MKKKIFSCIIIIMLLVALPSCAGILIPPEGLMRPPIPPGVSSEILQAFEREVGTDYRLRFERNGNHASILTHDLTGNGTLNAALFYSLLDEGDTLHIHILEFYDDEWVSIYDKTTTGLGVERIEVGYIIDENIPSLVVGKTSLLDNQRVLSVFTLTNEILEESFTTNYMEFYVTDIDRDGLDNVIFMQYDPALSFIDAQVVAFSGEDEQFFIKYSTPVDSEVTSFLGVQSALLTEFLGNDEVEKVIGIYFDAIKADGRIITELLYIPSGDFQETAQGLKPIFHSDYLRAPFTDPSTRTNITTERRSTRHSVDIDGSGRIAIPGDILFAGSEHLYITRWYVYQGRQMENISTSYIDRSGFMFDLQNLIFNDTTLNIAIDEDTRERVFSVYDIESNLIIRELFRVILTTETWWQQNGETANLHKVGQFQNVVFLAQMVDNELHGDGFDLTSEDVAARFAIFHDTADTALAVFEDRQGE